MILSILTSFDPKNKIAFGPEAARLTQKLTPDSSSAGQAISEKHVHLTF